MAAMVSGVDIGGTKIELGVFDSSMEQSASWREPTPCHDYTAFLHTIARMVRKADDICGGKQALGLALPGIVDNRGHSTSIHVPCMNGKRVTRDIERMLDRSVAETNDLRAFAISEARGGAIDGARTALAIILGTGVGGTLLIDGRPVRGRNNIAGEYGHIPMAANLVDKYGLPTSTCPCGASGCAEPILSGPGMLRTGSSLGANYASVADLIEHLRNGDPIAERVFDAYIDCLGYFVSRLTLMLDPDAVVFGGGLSHIVEIYERVPAATKAYLFEGVDPPPIAAPTFGPTSGARGAALVALDAVSQGLSP